MNKIEFTHLLTSEVEMLLLDIREPKELLIEETIPGSENVSMGKLFTIAASGILLNTKSLA